MTTRIEKSTALAVGVCALLLCTVRLNAQKADSSVRVRLTGIVTDQADAPVAGALVLELGHRGVTTNALGQYSIDVRADRTVWLRVSALGFQPVTERAKDGQRWRLVSLRSQLKTVAVLAKRRAPASDYDSPVPPRSIEFSSVGFGAIPASDQGDLTAPAAAANGFSVGIPNSSEAPKLYAVSRNSSSTVVQLNGARIYTSLAPIDAPMAQRVSFFSSDLLTAGHGSGLVELLLPRSQRSPAGLVHAVSRVPYQTVDPSTPLSSRAPSFGEGRDFGAWFATGEKSGTFAADIAVSHQRNMDQSLQGLPNSLDVQRLPASLTNPLSAQLKRAKERGLNSATTSILTRLSFGDTEKRQFGASLLGATRGQNSSIRSGIESIAIGGRSGDHHLIAQLAATAALRPGVRLTALATGGLDQWQSRRADSDSSFITYAGGGITATNGTAIMLVGPSVSGESSLRIGFAQIDLRGTAVAEDSSSTIRFRLNGRTERAVRRSFESAPLIVSAIPNLHQSFTLRPDAPSVADVFQLLGGASVERRVGRGFGIELQSSANFAHALASRPVADARSVNRASLGLVGSSRYEHFGRRVILPGRPIQPLWSLTAALGRFVHPLGAIELTSATGVRFSCDGTNSESAHSSESSRCLAPSPGSRVGSDRSNLDILTTTDKATATFRISPVGPISATFRLLEMRENGLAGLSSRTGGIRGDDPEGALGSDQPLSLLSLQSSRAIKVRQISAEAVYRFSAGGTASLELLRRGSWIRGNDIREEPLELCCSWRPELGGIGTFIQATAGVPVANMVVVIANLQVRSGVRWRPIEGYDSNNDGFLNDAPSVQSVRDAEKFGVRGCRGLRIDGSGLVRECYGPWSGRLSFQIGLNPDKVGLPRRLYVSLGVSNALPLLTHRLNDSYGSDLLIDRRASTLMVNTSTGRGYLAPNQAFGRLFDGREHARSQIGLVFEGRWSVGPSASERAFQQLTEPRSGSDVERDQRLRARLIAGATNVASAVRALESLRLSKDQADRLKSLEVDFTNQLLRIADKFTDCSRRRDSQSPSPLSCFEAAQKDMTRAIRVSAHDTRAVLSGIQYSRLPWVYAALLDDRTLRIMLPRTGRSFISGIFNP